MRRFVGATPHKSDMRSPFIDDRQPGASIGRPLTSPGRQLRVYQRRGQHLPLTDGGSALPHLPRAALADETDSLNSRLCVFVKGLWSASASRFATSHACQDLPTAYRLCLASEGPSRNVFECSHLAIVLGSADSVSLAASPSRQRLSSPLTLVSPSNARCVSLRCVCGDSLRLVRLTGLVAVTLRFERSSTIPQPFWWPDRSRAVPRTAPLASTGGAP